MKKLFLITLLCSVSFLTFSATDSTKIVPTTFDKVYTDVKDAVVAISGALKVGADHVYMVLVKQQFVYAITYTIALSVLILTALFMIVGGHKKHKRQKQLPNYRDTDFTGGEIWFIIGMIVMALSVIFFFVFISDIVTGFVNPEYGALKEIMKFIE